MLIKSVIRTVCVSLAVTLLHASALEQEFRVWTSNNGSTIAAQFVRHHGATVTLKNRADKKLSIRFADLITDDQEYVRALMSAERKAAEAKRAAFLKDKTRDKVAVSSKDPKPNYLSKKEWAVIQETSLARQNPKLYADYIRQFRRTHLGGNAISTPHGVITTTEGVVAVDEAIAFLEDQRPMKGLKPSEGLTRASRDHAEDIGPKGIVGHSGSDKSQPVERVERHGQWKGTTGENIQFGSGDARRIVIQLIIDDGVPDRGHRRNIFNEGFKVAGVAIEPHKQYESCCVIAYAGGFSR